tara:strand:+ start:1822 stop:2376 length:555 start_codon:yes stop_codon:yes gene_type:complete
MGLLDKLQNDGSALSVNNGQTPPTNPLSTNQSKLHAAPNGMLGASMAQSINANLPGFFEYRDGVQNVVPTITSLSKFGQHSYYHNVGPNNPFFGESLLHASPQGAPGFSLTGLVGSSAIPNVTSVQQHFILNHVFRYDDGVNNSPPNPSTLDLNGAIPQFSNHGNPLGFQATNLPYSLNVITDP